MWCADAPRGGYRSPAAATFGLYGKYSMALLLVALLIGLLLTKERRDLATPWLAICAAIVASLVLPNLWWQAAHGWPFFAVLQGDAAHRHAFNNGWLLESQSLVGNAWSFAPSNWSIQIRSLHRSGCAD